ncbi:PREDICTED: uncharacterized protein LOC108976665 isoform X1 [Bactrocera latifrons]|uniref:uncharacterized protein LOC108976665 isoform X1 n=1 Tax=Bactrocera latifrons TaxID=174628 RepID=UPI0008DCCB44|nr:PREDICTED: uncharacterized protein LOC108976665 isoform X1 [Bactrocera latifrons]
MRSIINVGNCNLCDGSHFTKNSNIKWFVGTEPIETSADDTSIDKSALSCRAITPHLKEASAILTNITDEESLNKEGPQRKVYQYAKYSITNMNLSTDCVLKWLSRRQNSMPVQIDSEIFRVIPKHMRKRIKSANGCNNQNIA